MQVLCKESNAHVPGLRTLEACNRKKTKTVNNIRLKCKDTNPQYKENDVRPCAMLENTQGPQQKENKNNKNVRLECKYNNTQCKVDDVAYIHVPGLRTLEACNKKKKQKQQQLVRKTLEVLVHSKA